MMHKLRTFAAVLWILASLAANAKEKPIRLVATPALEGSSGVVTGAQMVSLGLPAIYEFDQMAAGMVRLMILPNESSYMPPVSQVVDVSIDVKVYDNSGSMTPYFQTNVVLTVHQEPFMTPQLPFKDQDILVFDPSTAFPGIYKIEVQINGILVNGAAQTTLPENVRLESTIDYIRYTHFDLSAPSGLSINLTDLDCNPSYSEAIKVNWTPKTGATYYELEYCVINNYQAGGGNRSVSTSEFDFKNNSTRIVTQDNSYYIPNVFDKGIFAYRVRALGHVGDATSPIPWAELPGAWSTNYATLSGHFEEDINWQYNATFAEEGKQKSVITYADGSGRSRQTITQNNSDHTTIAGQTIYDFTGRPAVTILPAPIPDLTGCSTTNAQNSYVYRPNLNLATGTSDPFSKYHFEMDRTLDPCVTDNKAISNTSGAGQYYSSANPNQTGHQAFVPDAAGYPYSQVEYMGDNTGRIKRQGGVGMEFQLGNHDTRFLYGAPEQIELDRLFGSEVGDASHYQKNMTIDANGQISLSYIDMNGKTIATSLAGAAPSNLTSISTPSISMLSDMFSKSAKGISQVNLLNVDEDEIVFNKTILVNVNNSPNTFTYSLLSEPLQLSCVPNICFNCVYDYDIKITDDCGNLVYPAAPVVGIKRIGRVTVTGTDTTFNLTCAGSPYQYTEITPVLVLNPGAYYVSKTLKINKEARDEYLKAYLDKTKNNCILDLADFESTEMGKIDSTGCAVTNANCFTLLGTKDEYVSKGKGTEQEWQKLYDQCIDEAKFSKTSCDSYLNQLLADVSPNGQYGSWTNPSDPLSVFNAQNLLPKNITTGVGNVPATPLLPSNLAYWRLPKLMPGGQTYFVDQNGQKSTIKLTKLPPGATTNPGDFDLIVINIALVFQSTPNNYYTYPENLANIGDFIARWQPSWAKSLVYMHPEYCYYQDCPNKFGATVSPYKLTSNDYDSNIMGVTTFNDAVTKNILVTSGGGYALNLTLDPACSTSFYAPSMSGTPLVALYNSYDVSMSTLNMHQFAAYMVKCTNQIGTNATNIPICTTFCDVLADNTASKDKQWTILKGLYLAAKSKLQAEYSDKLRLATGSTCAYYNGCIGKPGFDAYSSPLIKYNTGTGDLETNSPYFESDQPCNIIMKDLYATKVKRFGNINNPSPVDESEAAYQLYLKTGKCPNAFDLQNLADALAKADRLKNPLNSSSVPVPEALQNYPQLTVNLYNHFNNLAQPPVNYINYLWVTSIIGSNDLKVDLKNTFANTIAKTVTFHAPTVGTINWDQVTRITQLVGTSNTGGTYYFTCIAKEQTGSTYVYHTINGETDIVLTGCMFKDVCNANDFARELQTIMSNLKSSPNPSHALCNMFNAAPTHMGAPGDLNVYGNNLLKIKQTIGGSTIPDYTWNKTGPFSFEIYDDNTTGGCKIVINFLSLVPQGLTASAFNSIVSFSNIKSDYLNLFTMEARGANNVLLGNLKGEVFKHCGSSIEPLSMGECGKPDPIECKTKFHQNREDLEKLLKDIIVNKKYSTGTNNVMANANLNSSLISGLYPMGASILAIKHAVTNTYYRYLGYEFISITPYSLTNDSVAFTFKSPCIYPEGPSGNMVANGGENAKPFSDPLQGAHSNTSKGGDGKRTDDVASNLGGGGGGGGGGGEDPPPFDPNGCVETPYCTVWFKTNRKTTVAYGLNDVVSVDKLVGFGNTTGTGSYNDFYITFSYALGGTNYIDTLFGSSCFEIQNCNSCGSDVPPCCGGGSGGGESLKGSAGGRMQKSTNQLKAEPPANSGGIVYNRYLNAINALNERMAWPSGHSSYVTPAAQKQINSPDYAKLADAHLDYIQYFDASLDNRQLLSDIPAVVTQRDYFESKEYVYRMYKHSVERFSARTGSGDTDALKTLSEPEFVAGGYSAAVPRYSRYLDAMALKKEKSAVTLQSFAGDRKEETMSGNSVQYILGDRCDSLFAAYLEAYNYYVTAHPGSTPPILMTQTDFLSRNYCCPPNGYLYFSQYISSFYNGDYDPESTPPGPMPCDPPGTDPCTVLHANYDIAIADFNETGYALANEVSIGSAFSAYQEFIDGGYCDCVVAYIAYLNNFATNPPPESPWPLSIKDFGPCRKTECDKVYDSYLQAVNDYGSWGGGPALPIVYTAAGFTKDGYCYCAKAYISFLRGVISGAVSDPVYIGDHIDLPSFCSPLVLPCAQPDPLDTFASPVFPPALNPCAKYKIDLAKANAKLLYGQYVGVQSALFISQYNAKCLAATENMFRGYTDQEYQYTLYYYDQAGNLIKTIPPAGLDYIFYSSIKKYNDANAVKVKNDRNSRNKSVMVDHGLASNYVYNSLNQLVRQKIPDHTGIVSNNFKYRYSFGVDTLLDVISSQVIDQNRGYLAGNQKVSSPYYPGDFLRAKLFESHDACETWQRVGGVAGTDIKKMQLIEIGAAEYGFAVGSDGVFMVSYDGGNNWDQYPLPELSQNVMLNDLKAIVDASNNIIVTMVGDHGKILKAVFSTGAAPAITDFNQLPSGTFGLKDSITDVTGIYSGGVSEFYVTVYDTIDTGWRIYKRGSGANWTDITGTKMLDLNSIRHLKGTSDCYAVGKDGTLIKSKDDGDHWFLQQTGVAGNIKDVYFATTNLGVAVIEDLAGLGKLYKTLNGGRTWSLLDQSTTNDYRNLSPYYFSSTVDRITANGENMLVKRVTIDFTNVTPYIGAVSTSVNTGGTSQTINDVAVVPYDNNGRWFAMACGSAGDIFFCSDFAANNVKWEFAQNLTGNFPKKIVFNILNPNGMFTANALVLNGPGSASQLDYIRNSPAFDPADMSLAVTWNTGSIPLSGSASGIVFNDLCYDLHATNPHTRAFLFGVHSSGVCRVSPFSLTSALSVLSSPSPYSNPGSTPNKNMKSFCVNHTKGFGLAVNLSGDLIKYTYNTSVTQYNDQTETIVPSKINDIQMHAGKVIVMGDDGFCADKTASSSGPFQVQESRCNLNYKAFEYYVPAMKMMVVCDNGVICDVTGQNFLYGGTTLTISSEHLNDFAGGYVPGTSNALGHIYFVGDKGTIIHSSFLSFVSNAASSAVFTPIYANAEGNITTANFDTKTGLAVCGGDNTQSFNLGGATSFQNTNWFTNEVTKLHFTDADNGFIVGKRGMIKKTSDGGVTWRTVRPYVSSSLGLSPDLYAVYTTAPDTAVIGGTHGFLANVKNTYADPYILPLGANASKWIHDIDLSTDILGFAVGTEYSPDKTSALKLTLNDHLVTSHTDLAPGFTNAGFRSVYAFKGTEAGKFIAVGLNATVKYYDASNFGTTITWHPLSGSMFGATDLIWSVNFADNNGGFLGGVKTKLGAITIDHGINQVDIYERNATSTKVTGSLTDPVIKTISIVDNGGVMAFMAGSWGNFKYNWKFGQESGKYTGMFWYDRMGRMVLSQSAVQSPNKYSYTMYDALGRIEEVGLKTENAPGLKQFADIFGTLVNMAQSNTTIDDTRFKAWLKDGSGARTEVTKTYYDRQVLNGTGSCGYTGSLVQENLRKRISSVVYKAVEDGFICNYEHATHYSYDINGNVKMLVQENKKLGAVLAASAHQRKIMYYDYDQVSGKVNQVSYQPGEADAFYHQYEYDADNRLIEVKTSRNGLVWETDAKYFYYKHGALARIEYGHDKVQGVDYAYTLQGWIKGVNGNKLEPANDIGGDGTTGGTNAIFARDASGFTLDYYTSSEDYTPVSSAAWSSATRFAAFTGNSGTPSTLHSTRKDLYNGNISVMATSISEPFAHSGAKPPTGFALTIKPLANAYKYDQLNRLMESNSFPNFRGANNDWMATNASIYHNSFTYDANGNILRQWKKDDSNTLFDDLYYMYVLDSQGRPTNNKLTHVDDAVASGQENYDLDDQGGNNYAYDGIGNMVEDFGQNIGILGGKITWNNHGKIKEITRNVTLLSTEKNLKFDYDAQGNRIARHIHDNNGAWEKSTYYVRDATGNVMATYEAVQTGGNPAVILPDFSLKEHPIYGSSRIGMDKHEVLFASAGYGFSPIIKHERYAGSKHFELSNHLGNINAVLSDIKVPVPDAGGTQIDYFVADMVSATDYYPFGQVMEGRDFSSENYRYGFNGKESDNEFKGTGNSMDFGARIYDPRLGRWLSLDPLMVKYPEYSPYNYTANNPVLFVDKDGRDYGVYINHEDHTIIIKATVYSNKSDRSAAQLSANHWNAQNGKFEYKVGEGKDAVIYKIKFDIQVPVKDKNGKPLDSDEDRNLAFRADKSGEANRFRTITDPTEPQGNSYSANLDKSGKNATDVRKGYTESRMTGGHELGHLLGIAHWKIGLMKEGKFRTDPNEQNITAGNVSKILSRISIGTQTGENTNDIATQEQPEGKKAAGKVKSSTGTAPANFNNGTVQKKQ